MTAAAHTIANSTTSVSPTSNIARRQSTTKATAMRWAGRILTGLPVAFLTFDAIVKLAGPKIVADTMAQLGWSANLAAPLGIVLLTCVMLYAIPRTAALGALLLTAYLGGAVATHVRVGDPLFSHILFPAYVGAMIWAGLYLRDARVRALIPFRGTNA